MKNSIFWFKNDQRLLDNEALCRAIALGQPLLPIYIIDPRTYNTLVNGERKSGYIRYKFLMESLQSLKAALQELGADLEIQVGHPEELIPQLVIENNVDHIFCEQEYAYEELQILKKLKKNMPINCRLKSFWGKTLYHLDDIPYQISELPKTSKTYRIHTSKNSKVRTTFEKILPFTTIPNYSYSDLTNASSLGFEFMSVDENLSPYVKGGEKEALSRLQYYTFESKLLTSYKWTRNRSLGMDYSSKLSPYLALGNISPRVIYERVLNYEKTVKKNVSTWWLVFELVWRDYFTFKGMHYGTAIFKTDGFKNKNLEFTNHPELFQSWKNGTTGIPFIDAHMRQLNTTGYMSNRGRVNCASFLIHDLKVDWTWGASYFETQLIDYDVTSNWLNWHMQAYEIWYTNPVNQALKYHAGAFIKTYITELQHMNEDQVLAPWLFDKKTYCDPIVFFDKWNRAINLIKKKNGWN